MPEEVTFCSLLGSRISEIFNCESHFIPEEVDGDDLFEDEPEKHKKGEHYTPGEASGETISRLSHNSLV